MLSRGFSAHVSLSAKFIVPMLLIDFTLVIISMVGVAGKLPGSVGFWCCIFVSTLGMSFFVAGMVVIVGRVRFLCTLYQRTPLEATITGKKKEKRRSSSDRNYYQILYYPEMAYTLGGESHTQIGSYGSTHPKWSVGDSITLYADPRTGAVAEKRDGFVGLGMGIFSATLGGALTLLFWTLYFGGRFAA